MLPKKNIQVKIRAHAVSVVHIVVVQITRRVDIELIGVVIVEVIRRAGPPKRVGNYTRVATKWYLPTNILNYMKIKFIIKYQQLL